MPSSNRVARTGIINEFKQVLILVEIIFWVYPQTVWWHCCYKRHDKIRHDILDLIYRYRGHWDTKISSKLARRMMQKCQKDTNIEAWLTQSLTGSTI